MATITSAQSGNFSAPSTWVGGVVPASVDIAVAATGHVVVIDTNVTVTEFNQTGTGKFTLGNGITATGLVRGNAGTTTTGGTIEVVATTVATINGNIVIGAASSNSAAIVVTGTGTVNVNGTITNTNSGTTRFGIWTATSCTLNVTGDIVFVSSATNLTAIRVTAAATTATLSFTGNITAIGSQPTYGIDFSPSGTLALTGTFTNSQNNISSIPVNVTANATVTLTGNAIGGGLSCPAISLTGTSPIFTMTGNATGVTLTSGSGDAGAIDATGTNATLVITGNVTGNAFPTYGVAARGASSYITVIGTVTGVGSLGHGVLSGATANGVRLNGSMVDSPAGAVAIRTRLLRVDESSGTTRYAGTIGFPAGTPVTRYSAGMMLGQPSAANVRFGTVYGPSNELTGALAVPPANAVASGVPVDNTVGTAALSPADIAALVGAQVAAAVSSPQGP